MKIKKNNVFKINGHQSIELVNLCLEGNHLYRYDKVKLIFKDHDRQYLLYENDLIAAIDSFKYVLEKTLKDRSELHNSISSNIGKLWNDYLQKKNLKTFEMEDIEGRKSWIGMNFLIFSSELYDTWLYNKNSLIFIEISPIYPWHFKDAEQNEQFIPYETWIKNYRPIFLCEISKKVAKHWYYELEKIFNEIEASDKKFLYKQ